jgi:cell division protein FtsI/penicillin-binding protein 2
MEPVLNPVWVAFATGEVQIAQAYQTLFNDGKYVQLTILTKTYDPYYNETIKYPFRTQQIYTPANTRIIKLALRQTMQPGGSGAQLIKLLPRDVTFFAKTGTSDKAIHGYTVLCDGEILVVSYVSYGKNVNGRLELNNTPPIPFESGAGSAGVLAAMIYNELK